MKQHLNQEKKEYNKPPLTKEQHIKMLKERGMTFRNEKKADFLFENISYYRLSGYWFEEYLDIQEKTCFKENTLFEDAFERYCFDKELRKLVFSEIEKIEVSIRAQIINVMSLAYGPYWIDNNTLFVDESERRDFKQSLIDTFIKSDELFIRSFKEKYSNDLPPSWEILELISFGKLSKLYRNIQCAEKAIISNYYGLPEYVLMKWLHSLAYVRNICAHHTRLWNRHISISPILLRHSKRTWLKEQVNNNRIYFSLSIILFFLQTINPNSSFKLKIYKLIENYPKINIIKMGFPINFEKEVLWKR